MAATATNDTSSTTPLDQPVNPTRTTASSIARSTLLVIVAFGVAKGISLLQTFIIARAFGVSAEYDAYSLANQLPEIIFNLIAGGALAFAFLPVFTGLLARNENTTAWKTASHVINTFFTATLFVSLFAFVFAPTLISSVVAPSFSPENQALAASLMRVLLLSTILFSISGVVMGILQSHNRFLLPALAPILFDLGILFGVLFLIDSMGIFGLAWGAVIGAAAHLAIQIPGLFRVQARWFPEFGWRDPNFRRVLVLMLPRVIDLGLISVVAVIVGRIQSGYVGAASAYGWGWRLMQIPETLIGTAMGVVIFPTLAALSSLGDQDGKRDAMSGALRFILFATIPSAVALIVAGRPLIAILEGNAFDAEATDLVFSALQLFALGIIIHSVLEVVARSFYADKDTYTPLIAALAGAAVNIIAAFVFSSLVAGDQATPTLVGGLALANTLGVTIEVAVLMFILRRRWRGLNETALGRTVGKTVAASLIMAVVMIALLTLWNSTVGEAGFVLLIARLVVVYGGGAVAFFAAAYLLNMEEVRVFILRLLRRTRDAEVASA